MEIPDYSIMNTAEEEVCFITGIKVCLHKVAYSAIGGWKHFIGAITFYKCYLKFT